MITKQGFEAWVKSQIEDYPIEYENIAEVRFTPSNVKSKDRVYVDIIVYLLNEQGRRYLVNGETANEVHEIPLKTLI